MKQPSASVRLAALLGLAWLGLSCAEAATGASLFTACTACHGARGEGNPAVGAPAIAGQHEAYLYRQLGNFRSGARGTNKADVYGAQMRAANLAVLQQDANARALAQYVAALPKTKQKPGKFDARNGNNLYQGKCGACHGVQGEGNDALGSPRLVGLDSAYIKRQLKNFRDGVRGSRPDDKYGRQMAMMAPTLTTERDIDDVIGYLQTLGNAK